MCVTGERINLFVHHIVCNIKIHIRLTADFFILNMKKRRRKKMKRDKHESYCWLEYEWFLFKTL